MFNFDLSYKSDSFFAFLKSKKGTKSYLPMKLIVAQKPGSKLFSAFPPSGGQGVKITASSVLYFGCSKGF